ncbi:nuclear transport factor 2 family protein [Catenulispora sp. NF23]|uniref:nuclear transport factor 2 family protein n=1 Tax=Catenulispora pinistramenti TaxID=2705254 RepID=UPI001BA9C458|nr:nuclear transport factor 2 family protein [Catenulispora pinistramenti]MBS2539450.1 nuclear transport factor 2 family protein [Catenulispora pinistramenti]
MSGYDIQALADRAEITDLFVSLGRCLDEHDFDALKDVLTEDVVGTTPGGTREGRDALIAQARANHQDYDRLTHQFTSILVDVQGDTGTVRAYVTGSFGHAASPLPERVLVGLYRNKVVRTGAGWRISELTVEPKFRIEREKSETAAAAE